MDTKKILLVLTAVMVLAFAGYSVSRMENSPVDSTMQSIALSGTYVCLPYVDPSKDPSKECKFGLKTDDGVYYAVNFGASASAMEEFQNRKHIIAKGFVVPKEALNTDQWVPYNMKGIFTITERQDNIAPQGKLNINVICEGALAYMTFTDGESAEKFVTECKDGKHPEVIEQYKAQMGLGDGAAI